MDGLAIAASLVEVRRAAEGALVRTLHEPQPGIFLIGVFGAGEHTILLCPQAAEVYCTSRAFRNPERPSSFVMQLRKHLRGARIRSIRQADWERSVIFDAVRTDAGERLEATLVAELTGVRGNLLLLDSDGVILGSLRRDPRNPVGQAYSAVPGQSKRDPKTVTTDGLAALLATETPARALAHGVHGMGRRTAEDIVALAAGLPRHLDESTRIRDVLDQILRDVAVPQPHFSASLGTATFYCPPGEAAPASTFGEALDRTVAVGASADAPDDRLLRERLLQAIARATRTSRSLHLWLDAATVAPEMRRRADFLMLYAADLGRGAVAVEGEDPSGGPRLSFPLAPRLNGMENAQALYKKARKLDRGRPTVMARLRRIERDLVRFRAALDALDAGRDVEDDVLASLSSRRSKGQVALPSVPRQFVVDRHTILVGRNAAQNDDLVRRARPDDLWLHARDVAGSHVVVRRNGQAEVPAHVIQEAARLAARHSKADQRGKVAVVCTEARHVRKPRRSAPGLAIVTDESTLTVDLQETP
jgi:predicted ribosome quality control (RQC) complex YloA/Tae2 family protein